jgi:hypothetical protein
MSSKRPFRIFVGESSATADGARCRATAYEYAFAQDGAGRVVPVQLTGQIASRYFVEGHRAWAEMQGRVRRLCEASGADSRVFWNPSALVTYFNALDASGRDLLRISAGVDAPAATGRVWTTPSSWGEAHFCGEAALDALQRRRAGEDAERVYVLKDERGGNVLVVGARGPEMAWASPEGYDAWYRQDLKGLSAALRSIEPDPVVEAPFPRALSPY